jgi:hypothetical protein
MWVKTDSMVNLKKKKIIEIVQKLYRSYKVSFLFGWMMVSLKMKTVEIHLSRIGGLCTINCLG